MNLANISLLCRRACLSSLNTYIIMEIKLINIGFGNIVTANRVIAIVSPESAPIKRLINDARERGELIDATYGRRTRGVLISDNGSVILSSIQAETIGHRFMTHKNNSTDG
jgi:extracellular matrix regulatory protein A